MADTTFADQTTVIEATWLNGVNDAVYTSSGKTAVYVTESQFGGGADPTGVADSSAAIQAALDAYLTVTAPPGTYSLSTTLTLRTGSTLILTGAKLKLRTNANCPIIQNDDTTTGNSRITILGGELDSNKANQTASFSTLQFTKVTQALIQSTFVNGSFTVGYVGIGALDLLECSNCTIDKVRLTAAGSEGLYLRTCENITVSGGEYYSNTNGSGCGSDLGSHHTFIGIDSHDNAGTNISMNTPYSRVVGCTMSGSTSNGGMAIGHPASPASYSVITGNTITDNAANGITLQSSSVEVVISGNRVSGTTGVSNIGIRATDTSDNCTITGNVVVGNAFGVFLNTISGGTVSGNVVKNNSSTGITVQASTNCVVSGNISDGNATGGTGHGIFLNATSNNNIIADNQCIDTQAVKTQQRGIYSDGTNNSVHGNYCTNNTVSQLVLAATNAAHGNLLSSTDVTKIAVTLNAGTTTTVTNANIHTLSQVAIIPTSANAVTRAVWRSALAAGSLTLTHAAGGAADTLEVVLN